MSNREGPGALEPADAAWAAQNNGTTQATAINRRVRQAFPERKFIIVFLALSVTN
jgi:hypothetical protein